MWPFNRRQEQMIEIEQDVGSEIGVKEASYTWAPESSGRVALAKTIDEICNTDPVIEQTIRLVSRSASIFPDYNEPMGFKVTSKQPKIQSVIDSLLRRTNIQNQSSVNLYNIYKYGEIFLEIVYKDDNSGISALKPFARPYWIRVNRDEFGNLLTGPTSREPEVAAYDEYIDGYTFYVGLGTERIAHFAFNPDGAYGTAPLKAAIPSWKQLRAIIEREANVIAELRPLRLHKIPIPQSWDPKRTKQYIARYASKMSGKDVPTITDSNNLTISRRASRPLDIFMPCKIVGETLIEGTIENIDNPDLRNDMDLIRLWRGMALANLGVPQEYLPIETDEIKYTQRNEVQLKSYVFASTIRELQYCYREGIERIINIELLLNADKLGIDAVDIYEDELFKIITPRIPFIDDLANARVKQAQAQALLMGYQSGIPMTWWLQQVMDLSVDDVEELVPFPVPELDKEKTKPTAKPKAVNKFPGEHE